jgi:Na+-transporting NADH:ubiquinone oxidoreductase subunit NqrB
MRQCWGFLVLKNHTVDITENLMLIILARMPTMFYLNVNALTSLLAQVLCIQCK